MLDPSDSQVIATVLPGYHALSRPLRHSYSRCPDADAIRLWRRCVCVYGAEVCVCVWSGCVCGAEVCVCGADVWLCG